MAPSRGKGKTRATRARPGPSRSARSSREAEDAVPDVYEEMLAEEAKRNPQDDLPERPLKRRRVATGVRVPAQRPSASPTPSMASSPASTHVAELADRKRPAATPRTIEATDDESDVDSEFDFEDVDLAQPGTPSAPAADDDITDVSVSVEPSATTRPAGKARRKPASIAEKAYRLITHKAHVLCLIGHCMYVNKWCNDFRVQQHLHPLLSKKALTALQGKQDWTQFQNDRAFRDGLEQASEIFRGHFKVNASGMKRAQWPADAEEAVNHDENAPTGREELIGAAREMEGSQDTGNQLFCALLRSAGVDARLVCSLQALPLTTSQTKASAPQKPSKPVIRAMPPYNNSPARATNVNDDAVKSSSTIGAVPSARRRLGQPSFASSSAPPASTASPAKKTPVRKLDYPIFWVEAFNTAHQKWTAVDPLVTKTIGKPSKFEPPSSYALNQMSYVIAFEEDGVARDVTRRYAKAYNAKTRRTRVESTDDGTSWFKKALRLLRRRGRALDRDQTEDAELNQKEAREGLPANLQDFKDHPVYALERHLKRHEMIEPKREVGKVNAGTAAKPRMEPVYRRSDVVTCRSADKWYRLGRVIQEAQAPIKHVPSRNVEKRRSMSPAGEAEGAGLTALYASFQTEMYVAPPVVKGRVPRNAFGNLDIYVPSMVPPGGTHIRHALVQQAARILRVDYADAVTGFQFKGRHGTAIIQGAIVPAECAEAVGAVIDGLLSEQLEDESLARSGVALRMWKRFLVGLRIKERVSAYGTEGGDGGNDVRGEIDRQVDEQEEIAEAGGFFAEEPAMPTAGKFSLVEMARKAKATQPPRKGRKRVDTSDSGEEDAVLGRGSPGGNEALARRSKRVRRTVVRENEDDEDFGGLEKPTGPQASHAGTLAEDQNGGGFVPEGENRDPADVPGGGFIPDDAEAHDYEGDGGIIPEDEEEGGGFLPEDDHLADPSHPDGAGGGFLPDDRDAGTPSVPNGNSYHPRGRNGAGKSAGTPEMDVAAVDPVSNPQLAEYTPVRTANERSVSIAQQEEASPQGLPSGDSVMIYGALPADAEADEAGTTASSVGDMREAREEATRSQSGGEGWDDAAAEEEAEEESDRGSMLSHDPDDEDAEPDWLESD